ncbi:MAG: DUF255 domain-containing protein [Gammaproteobacteria bacterium]|nr:DUF255 domain-containing protein [Gammaproteobacteria bacterium]MDH5653950.1 DUF255 domain-containing protein [Gammaproteobacteria bacterium]
MLRSILCLLLLLGSSPLTAASLVNQLRHHTSPYLAMHADDPVQWQEWNAATVARAKREGKLLFVSSGYFSCHWCHVMQRESYRNQAIARILNTHFIPVKVDREVHAALDARLIDFVERTQGYSGWPLNVFVTPDGYPLVGMVYLPPDSFQKVLENLVAQWQQKQGELAGIAQQAGRELQNAVMAKDGNVADWLIRDLADKMVTQTYSLADEMQGGFGNQNKFPSVPQLLVLLQRYAQHKDPRLKKILLLNLDQMATQGLRDHLGGGFFRYSVDPGWQIPHFEKMLYDNALLAEVYFRAAGVFARPDYALVARETLDFVLRDMATAHAGYATSLSAVDDKGIEGGYYLWEADELRQVLNKDELAVANLVWALEGPADIEHGQHLVLATDIPMAAQLLKMTPGRVETLLASARSKLLQARSKRRLPKDSKRIAAWNGLLLSALVEGAKQDDGERYRLAAQRLADELAGVFWDGKRLWRAAGANKRFGEAGLEDYAYVSRGLLHWTLLTRDEKSSAVLTTLIEQAWQRFYSPQGWNPAENMLLRYGAGQDVIPDGPMPSPSAVLIDVTLTLSRQGRLSRYREQALQAMNSGQPSLLADPFWFATHIGAMLRYRQPG